MPALALRTEIVDRVARLDARVLDRDGAVDALREWTAIANSALTACSVLAARVDECGPPPSAGARTAAEFIAKETGTTTAQVKQRIETGTRLQTAPRTRAKAAAGQLSPEQAEAIVDAVAADPSAEEELLSAAETASIGGLRDACAAIKAAVTDMEARERNIHANRCVRRYRDREGAEHLHAVGTKRDLAIIDKALERLVDQRFNAARRDGTREPLEVYAFDALRLLAEESMGPGEQRGPARVDPIRHLAVLRIDLTALTRGRVERDEACEIAGLGPISVAAAREMLGESVLKLVITRGVDVVNVTHLGRGPNTAQKVALLCNSPSVHERDAGGTRGSITTIAKTSHGHDTPASTKPIPSATLITI